MSDSVDAATLPPCDQIDVIKLHDVIKGDERGLFMIVSRTYVGKIR